MSRFHARAVHATARKLFAGATLCILAGAAGAPAAAQSPRPACATGTLRTAAGPICGAYDTTMVAGAQAVVPVYQGIPYAAPPTGRLRWQPTQPAPVFSTTLQATKFGPMCPQPPFTPSLQSEDCLYLNVWTPPSAAAGKTVPVMVFIHGGAYLTGAGSSPTYRGAYLAAADTVVVVTINYRLGALGFLYAGTSAPNTVAGNFGLMDQQAALRWVRANITAFGGDTARVTAFGESAGAMSVGFHLFAMPSSNSLFRAAIMESNPMGVVYRTTTEAQRDGDSYIMRLCKMVMAPLRCEFPGYARRWFNTHYAAVSTENVMAAQASFDSGDPSLERFVHGGDAEALPWTPVIDGTLVQGQPLRGYVPGARRRPYIFGFNRDEGVLFAALGKLGAVDYNLLLDFVFGLHGAGRVRGFTAGGETPYNASRADSVAGMNRPASALSNLIGDMAFDCANLASADSAYLANQAVPGQPPIFAYEFVRSPIPFNLYQVEACSSASGMVCHGDELPYVFNTIAYVDSTKAGSPTAADTSLARQMASAWGNFAKNPTQPPVSGWRPYTKGGLVYPWAGIQNGPMQSGKAQAAHCTALWYTLPPLAAGRAGAGR